MFDRGLSCRPRAHEMGLLQTLSEANTKKAETLVKATTMSTQFVAKLMNITTSPHLRCASATRCEDQKAWARTYTNPTSMRILKNSTRMTSGKLRILFEACGCALRRERTTRMAVHVASTSVNNEYNPDMTGEMVFLQSSSTKRRGAELIGLTRRGCRLCSRMLSRDTGANGL